MEDQIRVKAVLLHNAHLCFCIGMFGGFFVLFLFVCLFVSPAKSVHRKSGLELIVMSNQHSVSVSLQR